MLSVFYSKCHLGQVPFVLSVIYAKGPKLGLYADCHYAESHYAECLFAECRGGLLNSQRIHVLNFFW